MRSGTKQSIDGCRYMIGGQYNGYDNKAEKAERK